MSLIKKTELKQMDEKKLKGKLIELRKEMIKIRSQISTGTLPQNPGGVKEIRRTIAKLLQRLDQKDHHKPELKPSEEVKKKA